MQGTDVILLGHGSGGRLSHQLLDEVIIPALTGTASKDQDDAAILSSHSGRLAFTTDSYVVDPLFLPGGCIGDLAINGTVNDLAMVGACPQWLSVGLIIEEGLPVEDLRRILDAMHRAAERAGVRIVTGDTKVVPRGKGDRLFINTAGIGIIDHDLEIRGSNAHPGDIILINGTIGDHGMAVLASREGLQLSSEIRSDSAPLNHLVNDLITAIGKGLHVLRDPTRGGVATTLKEIAQQSQREITLHESALPVTPAVAGACAILGLDPLYIANEGKLLAIVAPECAAAALEIMRRHPAGSDAVAIGSVAATTAGRVTLETAIGGRRSIEMLAGDQLPRIC